MNETDARSTPSERLAAVGALAALAGAMLLLAIGGASNLEAVLLLLAGMLLVIVAGWYTVSRRGSVRFVSLLVVAAGLGSMIFGLVVADLNALRVATLFALAALSVGMARHALRKSSRALSSAAGSSPAVSPAKHPVLIMNLRSGGGKAERFHLVEECHRRGIEPVVLGPGDDLLQLAEKAIARGADVIGMAGGDGSQALVATVAARHRVPHVVVPAGTRNHFALDLGLDREDVVGALDAYVDGVERRIDLARVNGRIFVNNATMGLYAKIVQSPEYRDAKGETALAMLPDLLGPDASPLDLRFAGPTGTRYETAHVVLVSNNPYELDRIAGRGTREHLDLGVLGIAAATVRDAGDAARFMTLEASGHVRRYPGWLEWTDTRFQVDSAGPIDVGVDGEALVLDPPLVFETQPGALLVRLPRRAIGLSPAAKAVHLLSRSTLVQLVQVAGGRSALAAGS